MNTKPSKEEITNLLNKIEEIKLSLLYIATAHPVGKMLGVDKKQLQHLTELKLYMYIAWELYHYGDVNSILSEKDRKLIQVWGKNSPEFRNMLKKWLMFTGGAYITDKILKE